MPAKYRLCYSCGIYLDVKEASKVQSQWGGDRQLVENGLATEQGYHSGSLLPALCSAWPDRHGTAQARVEEVHRTWSRHHFEVGLIRWSEVLLRDRVFCSIDDSEVRITESDGLSGTMVFFKGDDHRYY